MQLLKQNNKYPSQKGASHHEQIIKLIQRKTSSILTIGIHLNVLHRPRVLYHMPLPQNKLQPPSSQGQSSPTRQRNPPTDTYIHTMPSNIWF